MDFRNQTNQFSQSNYQAQNPRNNSIQNSGSQNGVQLGTSSVTSQLNQAYQAQGVQGQISAENPSVLPDQNEMMQLQMKILLQIQTILDSQQCSNNAQNNQVNPIKNQTRGLTSHSLQNPIQHIQAQPQYQPQQQSNETQMDQRFDLGQGASCEQNNGQANNSSQMPNQSQNLQMLANLLQSNQQVSYQQQEMPSGLNWQNNPNSQAKPGMLPQGSIDTNGHKGANFNQFVQSNTLDRLTQKLEAPSEKELNVTQSKVTQPAVVNINQQPKIQSEHQGHNFSDLSKNKFLANAMPSQRDSLAGASFTNVLPSYGDSVSANQDPADLNTGQFSEINGQPPMHRRQSSTQFNNQTLDLRAPPINVSTQYQHALMNGGTNSNEQRAQILRDPNVSSKTNRSADDRQNSVVNADVIGQQWNEIAQRQNLPFQIPQTQQAAADLPMMSVTNGFGVNGGDKKNFMSILDKLKLFQSLQQVKSNNSDVSMRINSDNDLQNIPLLPKLAATGHQVPILAEQRPLNESRMISSTISEKFQVQPLVQNQSEALGGITDSAVDKSDQNNSKQGLSNYDKSEPSQSQKSVKQDSEKEKDDKELHQRISDQIQSQSIRLTGQSQISESSTPTDRRAVQDATISQQEPDSAPIQGTISQISEDFLLSKQSSKQSIKESTESLIEFNIGKFLSDNKYKTIFKWTNNGKAFLIVDKDAFVKSVMPKIAKHKSFPSFVRQLLQIGFKKIKRVEGYCFYKTDFTAKSVSQLHDQLKEPIKIVKKPKNLSQQPKKKPKNSSQSIKQKSIQQEIKSEMLNGIKRPLENNVDFQDSNQSSNGPSQDLNQSATDQDKKEQTLSDKNSLNNQNTESLRKSVSPVTMKAQNSVFQTPTSLKPQQSNVVNQVDNTGHKMQQKGQNMVNSIPAQMQQLKSMPVRSQNELPLPVSTVPTQMNKTLAAIQSAPTANQLRDMNTIAQHSEDRNAVTDRRGQQDQWSMRLHQNRNRATRRIVNNIQSKIEGLIDAQKALLHNQRQIYVFKRRLIKLNDKMEARVAMLHKRCTLIKQGDTDNQKLNLNLMEQLSKSVDEFNRVFTGQAPSPESPASSSKGEVSDVIFRKIQHAAQELMAMEMNQETKNNQDKSKSGKGSKMQILDTIVGASRKRELYQEIQQIYQSNSRSKQKISTFTLVNTVDEILRKELKKLQKANSKKRPKTSSENKNNNDSEAKRSSNDDKKEEVLEFNKLEQLQRLSSENGQLFDEKLVQQEDLIAKHIAALVSKIQDQCQNLNVSKSLLSTILNRSYHKAMNETLHSEMLIEEQGQMEYQRQMQQYDSSSDDSQEENTQDAMLQNIEIPNLDASELDDGEQSRELPLFDQASQLQSQIVNQQSNLRKRTRQRAFANQEGQPVSSMDGSQHTVNPPVLPKSDNSQYQQIAEPPQSVQHPIDLVSLSFGHATSDENRLANFSDNLHKRKRSFLYNDKHPQEQIQLKEGEDQILPQQVQRIQQQHQQQLLDQNSSQQEYYSNNVVDNLGSSSSKNKGLHGTSQLLKQQEGVEQYPFEKFQNSHQVIDLKEQLYSKPSAEVKSKDSEGKDKGNTSKALASKGESSDTLNEVIIPHSESIENVELSEEIEENKSETDSEHSDDNMILDEAKSSKSQREGVPVTHSSSSPNLMRGDPFNLKRLYKQKETSKFMQHKMLQNDESDAVSESVMSGRSLGSNKGSSRGRSRSRSESDVQESRSVSSRGKQPKHAPKQKSPQSELIQISNATTQSSRVQMIQNLRGKTTIRSSFGRLDQDESMSESC